MKTKSILISLLFIICFLSYGQKHDLKKMGLHGDVKSLHEYSYQPVDENGKIQKGKLEFSYYNTFNSMGNKLIDIKYGPDGNVDKKYVYTYDNDGYRRTEQQQLSSDGKLIRKITYKYDEQGNLIEDNSFSPEGKPEKKITYKYDNNGNVIEDNSFDAEGKLMKRFTYTYDGSSNKIENSRFSSQGALDSKVTYKYDDKNNIIEETVTNANGTVVITTYTYEYDRQNSWIRMVRFTDKKAVSIIEREIEYY